jgi:hypothetical protein
MQEKTNSPRFAALVATNPLWCAGRSYVNPVEQVRHGNPGERQHVLQLAHHYLREILLAELSR